MPEQLPNPSPQTTPSGANPPVSVKNPSSTPGVGSQTTNQPPDNKKSKILLFVTVILIMMIILLGANLGARQVRTSLPQPKPSPTTQHRPPSSPSPQVPGWKQYTSTISNYSFDYPAEYRMEKGDTTEQKNQLVEKVDLYHPKYKNPLLKIIIWKNTSSPLQKKDIEKWCFETLLNEARKENILCAFLTAGALESTEIDNQQTYTVTYYNSDQEKVNFYVIPTQANVITITATTFLNEKSYDNGESKAKEILKTIRFKN